MRWRWRRRASPVQAARDRRRPRTPAARSAGARARRGRACRSGGERTQVGDELAAFGSLRRAVAHGGTGRGAVIEALAAGVPVIGARVGGIPEVLDHGACGVLVEPESPPALADRDRAPPELGRRAPAPVGSGYRAGARLLDRPHGGAARVALRRASRRACASGGGMSHAFRSARNRAMGSAAWALPVAGAVALAPLAERPLLGAIRLPPPRRWRWRSRRRGASGSVACGSRCWRDRSWRARCRRSDSAGRADGSCGPTAVLGLGLVVAVLRGRLTLAAPRAPFLVALLALVAWSGIGLAGRSGRAHRDRRGSRGGSSRGSPAPRCRGVGDRRAPRPPAARRGRGHRSADRRGHVLGRVAAPARDGARGDARARRSAVGPLELPRRSPDPRVPDRCWG